MEILSLKLSLSEEDVNNLIAKHLGDDQSVRDVTVRLLPEKRTRAPFELGMSPSPASSTPARTSCSLYWPMAAISSGLGGLPASVSASALTMTMYRMSDLQDG